MNVALQYEIRRREVSDIWEHLPLLYETALSYETPQIIELGVRTGNSTAAFLAAIEKAGGHLWSVDIEKPRVPAGWHENPAWTLVTGDDRHADVFFRLCPQALPCADILFIDTSHEYQHTLDELELYVPAVRPGGTVLLHDTEWEGREVAKALDDFCPARGLTWENIPGCNGMGLVRIPEADGVV